MGQDTILVEILRGGEREREKKKTDEMLGN
jgi:hypothetical protein